MRLTPRPSDHQPQTEHLDLNSAETIEDSIALLRDENDRLRKMAASLSMETEDIRRTLSPAESTAWWPSSHLKAFL